LGLTFFGLTADTKLQIHKTLFSLAYYSNGGFTFEQVYNMPVYLRAFYIKQLEETKLRETELLKPKKTKPSKR
jgi:hypothetical protein